MDVVITWFPFAQNSLKKQTKHAQLSNNLEQSLFAAFKVYLNIFSKCNALVLQVLAESFLNVLLSYGQAQEAEMLFSFILCYFLCGSPVLRINNFERMYVLGICLSIFHCI